MNRIRIPYVFSLLLALLVHTPLFAQWVETGYGVFRGGLVSVYSDGTVLLAGTGGGGIYVSGNNGSSWHVSNNGMPSEAATSFVSLGGNVFVGTRYGIYVSADHGATWSLAGLRDTYISSLCVSGTVIYAGCFPGPFRSTDNGITWTPVFTGLPAQGVPIQAIAASGVSVFIADSSGSVYVSSDQGDHWTASPVIGQLAYCLTINGTHVFAGTNEGLFHSPDLGVNWDVLNNAPPYIYRLLARGGKIYAGTSSSVFVSSDNGLSWTSGTSVGPGFVSCIADGGSSILATLAGGGVFQSIDDGASWNPINNGLIRDGAACMLIDGSTLYAGSYSSVLSSTNGGATWSASTAGLTGNVVTALTVKGSLLFSGTDAGVKISSDNGITWTPASSGLANQNVTALAESGGNLYAGTTAGLFVSSNDGNLWTPVSTPSPSPNILTIYPDNGTVFVATPLAIYYSVNQGAGWQTVSLKGIKAFARLADVLLAGGDNGLYQSIDSGATWSRVAASWLTGGVVSLCGAGNSVFISTSLGDVFMYAGSSVVPLGNGLPYDISLPSLVSNGTDLFASVIPANTNDYGGIFTINTSGIATIRSMNPVTGIVGTPVTIEGTGFNTDPFSNVVQFNNRRAVVVQASATTLQVIAPSTAGNAVVKITVNGQTVTNQTQFEIIPDITGITPARGYAGSNVVLSGSGFDAASIPYALVNSIATSLIVSNTSVVVYIPVSASSGPISLFSNGKAYKSDQEFVVLPLITGFSPLSGNTGTTVEINGTGFGNPDDNVMLVFNGTPATIDDRNSLRIRTKVPDNAISGAITMTVNGNPSISLLPFMVLADGALCLTAPPQPLLSVIQSDGGVTLVSSASDGNQWYRNGSIIPGASSNQLPMTQPGTYTVRVKSGDCFSPYAESLVFGESITGIYEQGQTQCLSIFPNPASRTIMIDLGLLQKNVPVRVVLYNSLGQRVAGFDGEGGDRLPVAIDGYPGGVYFVLASQFEKVFTGKFVKD